MAVVTITSPDGSKRVEDGKGNVISKTPAPSGGSSSSSSSSYKSAKERNAENHAIMDAYEEATRQKVQTSSDRQAAYAYAAEQKAKSSGGGGTSIASTQPQVVAPVSLPAGAEMVGTSRIRYKGLVYDKKTFYEMQAGGQTVGKYAAPNADALFYQSNVADMFHDGYILQDPKTEEFYLAPGITKGTEMHSAIMGTIQKTPKGWGYEEREGGRFIFGELMPVESSKTYTFSEVLGGGGGGGSPGSGIHPSLDFGGALSKHGQSIDPTAGSKWVNPNVNAILGTSLGTGVFDGKVTPYSAEQRKEFFGVYDNVFGIAPAFEGMFPSRGEGKFSIVSPGSNEIITPQKYQNLTVEQKMHLAYNPMSQPIASDKAAWTALGFTVGVGGAGAGVAAGVLPAEFSGTVLAKSLAFQAGTGGTIRAGLGEGVRVFTEPNYKLFSKPGQLGIDFAEGAVWGVAFGQARSALNPIMNIQPGLPGEVGKRVVAGALAGGFSGASASASRDIFEGIPVSQERMGTYAATGVVFGGIAEGIGVGMEKGAIPRPAYTSIRYQSTKVYDGGIRVTQEYSYRGIGVEWGSRAQPMVGIRGGGGWELSKGMPKLPFDGATSFPMAFTPSETAILSPAYKQYYGYLRGVSGAEKQFIQKQIMEYAVGQQNKGVIVDYFMPKGKLEVAAVRYEVGSKLMQYTYYNPATPRMQMGLVDVMKGSPYFQKKGAAEAIAKLIKQDKAIVYGSMSQKGQMGQAYVWTPKDVDLMSARPEMFAQKAVNVLKPMYGSGVRISPTTPTLVEVNVGGKWAHMLDIHSSYGSSAGGVLNPQYIGFGLKNKPPFVTKEGYFMVLQEQGTRKFASMLTPRSFGPGPEAHRVLKDVPHGLSVPKFYATGEGNQQVLNLVKQYEATIPKNVLSQMMPQTTKFAIIPQVYYSPIPSAGFAGLLGGFGAGFAGGAKKGSPFPVQMSSPFLASPSPVAAFNFGVSMPSFSPKKSPVSSPASAPSYYISPAAFASGYGYYSPKKGSYSPFPSPKKSPSPSPYSPGASPSPSPYPYSPSPYPYSPSPSPYSSSPYPYSPSPSPYSPSPYPYFSEPPTPPVLPNFGLGSIKDFGGNMFGGGRQPKGYTPSLGGVLLGYSAKSAPTGMFSGLEMRPVVTSGKKKKRKGAQNPLEWIL